MTQATSRLLDVVLASLAPAFLAFTGGDIAHAREAALEAIDAYRSRGATDLIAIGQIISHGFASIASASQSLNPDLAENETLQHRRAAVSLARSAERTRKSIHIDPPPPPEPEPDDTSAFSEAEIDAFLASEPMARLREPSSPPPSAENAGQLWAIAMAKEADELLANSAHLPEKDRTLIRIQASALNSAANSLLTGQPIAWPTPAAKPEAGGANPITPGRAVPAA